MNKPMEKVWISQVCRSLAGVSMTVLLALATSQARAQSNGRTTLPMAKPESAGFSSERLQRIDDGIQRHMDAKRLSGAVTLVARKGKVVHYKAHGLADVEAMRPMRRDTIFQMASSTKPVAGVAVMLLIEEGKINLNDPASKFIPEFKTMKVAVQPEGATEVRLVPANREITIRDLMTHTSGLGSGGLGSRQAAQGILFPGQPNETLSSYVARLATVPLDFQPGALWRYSGLAGIDVLSRVVEVASGQSFDQFLRERIFEPLGMKDTFFVLPSDRQERRAKVYQARPTGLEPNAFVLRFPDTYFSGAGGLFSTAEDYFRFGQMLVNGGTYNGKRLLSPRSVELLSSNHVGDMFPGQLGRPKGMGFGLTVEVVQDSAQAGTYRSKGSFGWDGAFGTHFWVDPQEDLVAVLMIQTSVGRIIHRDYETAVMQALIEPNR